jgi:hypothetical protein
LLLLLLLLLLFMLLLLLLLLLMLHTRTASVFPSLTAPLLLLHLLDTAAVTRVAVYSCCSVLCSVPSPLL